MSDRAPTAYIGAALAVARHETRLLIHSPLTAIFQAGFLATLMACVFLIADFYSTDEASIQPMLVYLPWVALIFVPALAMRAWSDEHGDRGVELLLTLPVPVGAVVVGKFIAGYAVLLLTLLFTAPFVATVYYLGQPDGGVIAAGYLAAALLLAVYFAVALCAAALAREPVGAFVIGIFLLFVLSLAGWDAFGRLLLARVPAGAVEWISAASPVRWYNAIGRGLIDAGAIGYFALAVAAALLATGCLIAGRRRPDRTAGRWVRGTAATAAVVVLLPFAAGALARLPVAVDLTAEKEFTLHDGTRAVAERLPVGTEIVFYWSASQTTVPQAIKSHARRIGDLLRRIERAADGRLAVRVVDPAPDSDSELAAQKDGVQRVPMSSGDAFFFGATFRQGGRTGTIPYFDIRRDRQAEYDIAVALKGLSRARTPKVGVLSPLLASSAVVEGREGLSFLAEIKRSYDLAVIPFFAPKLPEDLDVLVIVDSTIMRRETLYDIDQFVMRGGGLIVMVDPFVRFNRASDRVAPDPSVEINDISDLLLAWGLRFDSAIVGDDSLASTVANERQETMAFPYWLRIGADRLAGGHPVTASLNEISLIEPGSFKIENAARFQPLVTTTEASGATDRIGYRGRGPSELAAAFRKDGRPRVLAAAGRAAFPSAFKTAPDGFPADKHLTVAKRPGIVFAVADADWIFDPFALQQVEIGGQPIVRPLNDNLTLLLNMVEFASGDPALISIRSRGQLQRPFVRVAALFEAARRSVSAEEQGLAQRIAEVERKIAEIVREAGAKSVEQLPGTLRREIEAAQKEMLPVRRRLRDVRRQIREEVERLGRRLVAINLLAGPALAFGAAGLAALWRRRRRMNEGAAR